jgi:hypothetical protein
VPGPSPADSRFLAEVLRIQERYAVEVIERFNICPWARHARVAGEIVRPVLLQEGDAPEPTLEVIAELEARQPPPPVAIVVYPRLRLDPRRFDEFAAQVRQRDQRRHGGKPIYVAATFHPDYAFDERTPSSLVPFLRRSPDPSLQLVRLALLEEARGGHHGKFLFDFSAKGWAELLHRSTTPSVTDRIALDNHATFAREGREAFEAVFDAIRADRERAYAPYLPVDSSLPTSR